MFYYYITLSQSFNICEKSWLITLLPDILQWVSQDSYADVDGLNDTIIAPAIRKNQSVCADPLEKTTSPQYPTLIPSTTTDGGAQCPPGKASTDKSKELLSISDNPTFQHQHSKLSTLTNEVLQLRTRATTNSSLPSVEAGTSVVKKANEPREHETEETIFADIPGGDWNFVESDNDGECVFLFSPPRDCEAFNYKPVSTSSPLSADIISIKFRGRILAAIARGQASEHIKRRGLAIIPEECEIGEEGEEIVLVYSHEIELDTTDLLKLPHAL